MTTPEPETHYRGAYKCPWCGYVEDDLFEMDFNDDAIDHECPGCGKPIRISESISYSYTTKPLGDDGELLEAGK